MTRFFNDGVMMTEHGEDDPLRIEIFLRVQGFSFARTSLHRIETGERKNRQPIIGTLDGQLTRNLVPLNRKF